MACGTTDAVIFLAIGEIVAGFTLRTLRICVACARYRRGTAINLTRRARRVGLRVALRRGPFTRLACLMSRAHLVLRLSFAVRRCFRPESTLPT